MTIVMERHDKEDIQKSEYEAIRPAAHDTQLLRWVRIGANDQKPVERMRVDQTMNMNWKPVGEDGFQEYEQSESRSWTISAR